MPKKRTRAEINRNIISVELERGARHVQLVRIMEAAQARLERVLDNSAEIERLKKIVLKQAAEIKRLRAAKRQ